MTLRRAGQGGRGAPAGAFDDYDAGELAELAQAIEHGLASGLPRQHRLDRRMRAISSTSAR